MYAKVDVILELSGFTKVIQVQWAYVHTRQKVAVIYNSWKLTNFEFCVLKVNWDFPVALT